jgi:hypothetical protein
VYPFNVRNFKKDIVDAEDGVATIDWVVLLAALTRLGGAGRCDGRAAGHPRTRTCAANCRTTCSRRLGGQHPGGSLRRRHARRSSNGDELRRRVARPAVARRVAGPIRIPIRPLILTRPRTRIPRPTRIRRPIPIRRRIRIPIPIPIPIRLRIPTRSRSRSERRRTGGTRSGPIVPTSNVQGCPDPSSYIAEPVATTGDDILDDTIKVNNMTVGGASTNLVNCPGYRRCRVLLCEPDLHARPVGHDGRLLALPGAHAAAATRRCWCRTRPATSISTTTAARL